MPHLADRSETSDSEHGQDVVVAEGISLPIEWADADGPVEVQNVMLPQKDQKEPEVAPPAVLLIDGNHAQVVAVLRAVGIGPNMIQMYLTMLISNWAPALSNHAAIENAWRTDALPPLDILLSFGRRRRCLRHRMHSRCY